MQLELPIDDNPIKTGSHLTTAQSCFYNIPACWIESAPNGTYAETPQYPNVIVDLMDCGIELYVRQDGLFLFDFKKYAPCAAVSIPVFEARKGYRLKLPAERMNADRKALEHAFNRCVVMNCFLACLNSAVSINEKRATPITQFTSPANYLTDELNPFWNPMHAHFLHNSNIKSRDILSSNTVKSAAELFNDLINEHALDCLIVLNTIYQAHYLHWILDFSNSLLLAWMASERLLNKLFVEYMKTAGDEEFDGRRKTKLKDGRTFTSAIVLEMLQVWKCIPYELYCQLEQVRKERNNWVHNLNAVDDEAKGKALRSAQQLFELVYQKEIALSIGSSYSY